MKNKQKPKKKLTLNQLTICKLSSLSLNAIKSGHVTLTLQGVTCDHACDPTLGECAMSH